MLPIFDKFIHPVLQLLGDGKEHKLTDLKQQIIKHFNLSEEDIQIRTAKGTQTQLYNRVQWSTTYLKKAGLIDKPRSGISIITAEGLKVLASGVTVTMEFLRSYSKEFLEFNKGTGEHTEPTPHKANTTAVATEIDETPEDAIDRNFKLVNQNLVEELLEKVKSMDPQKFEELVVKLLVKMGYGGQIEGCGTVTQYTRDGGIDGIIKEDKLGFDKIFIQAKRWDANVGSEEISKFVGSIDRQKGTKGVFITTSSFTKDAIAYDSYSKKIVLIDGKQLCEYMIEYNLGVSTKEIFEIKRIDTDFFSEEE